MKKSAYLTLAFLVCSLTSAWAMHPERDDLPPHFASKKKVPLSGECSPPITPPASISKIDSASLEKGPLQKHPAPYRPNSYLVYDTVGYGSMENPMTSLGIYRLYAENS